jgi:predicted acylesterase/phospholipase RssA
MESNKIKHIVLSGGSLMGFASVGILYKAIKEKFINIDEIESIYGTSVGSFVGLAYCLKLDPEQLINYIINRPWNNVVEKNCSDLIGLFQVKGFLQKSLFVEIFSSLFHTVDLSIETTMKELYEYNNIDFHIYTTELNTFEMIDISHKTHPDWCVIDAVYASCSIPILFSPIIRDGKCYFDGCFFLNFPMEKCIVRAENPEEIFGITLGQKEINRDAIINEESSIFDILNIIFDRIFNRVIIEGNCSSKPYIVHYINDTCSLDYYMSLLYEKKNREQLINNGIKSFMKQYDSWFS